MMRQLHFVDEKNLRYNIEDRFLITTEAEDFCFNIPNH